MNIVDSVNFQEFYSRSKQAHLQKHRESIVHQTEHFKNLALAKWSTLTQSEKESFQPSAMGKTKANLETPDRLRKVRTPKRAGKDPNAPKRAKSAYIVFTTSMTKQIRQENPSWTQAEVMKEAANRWNQVMERYHPLEAAT